MVGGLLAGAVEKTLKQMEKLGEYLGIVFQIRDDERDVVRLVGAVDHHVRDVR